MIGAAPSPPSHDVTATAPTPMIELRGVRKEFPGPTGTPVVAVDGVSLRVAAGELLCLIGTSGCGKTTTMKMINRLVEPSDGEIRVDGRDIRERDPTVLRRGIGYVIQKGGLFPHLSVAGNVGLLCRLEGWERARIEARLGLTLPLLAQKKWRPLEKACRDVLKLDAQNAVARARLAHAYYSIGNYPDSATVYRKLVRDYPAELDHQTGLGWALARMGRAGEAKKIFAEVLAVSPDNPNARQGMALP